MKNRFSDYQLSTPTTDGNLRGVPSSQSVVGSGSHPSGVLRFFLLLVVKPLMVEVLSEVVLLYVFFEGSLHLSNYGRVLEGFPPSGDRSPSYQT